MSVVQNRKAVKAENVHGGNGYILRDVLLQDNQLNGICTFAACITLEPGCEIAPHVHAEDTEMYFLIEGNALYNDNGEETEVHVGDVMFCEKGDSHAIKNHTDSPAKFVALIQK